MTNMKLKQLRGGLVNKLTVECEVKNVVCLDEVDVLVKQLDPILVIHDADVVFVFIAKTLASFLLNLLQGRFTIVAKLHHILLGRLVHASV